jgi:hypothetical protein
MENHGYCGECGEECIIIMVDDSFSYAGTHCTGGIGGVHQASHFESDCCEAEAYTDPELRCEFTDEDWDDGKIF